MQVGHAGTLDPMATGLLILCTGKATKAINTYVEANKAYTGTLVSAVWQAVMRNTWGLCAYVSEDIRAPGSVVAHVLL